eukprot:gene39532-8461_t
MAGAEDERVPGVSDPRGEEDGTSALQDVRQRLRRSELHFTSDSQARIISGEEEAVYGWIA